MTSRRKNAEKEFWKIGGLILELFALPILIMVAVLLNMPDTIDNWNFASHRYLPVFFRFDTFSSTSRNKK